jgi:hypothetical protein
MADRVTVLAQGSNGPLDPALRIGFVLVSGPQQAGFFNRGAAYKRLSY